MIRTVVTVVFIAGVGGGAAFIAQQKTVIRGNVMAADLLEQLHDRGITEIQCDDAEVKQHGATFICRVADKYGARATFEYLMNREGSISGKQLGDVDRSESAQPERGDPSGDPWAK